jgi:cytochrome c oxidase subunit II
MKMQEPALQAEAARAAVATRRQYLYQTAVWCGVPAVALMTTQVRSADAPVRSLKLVAQRFHYTPHEISMKPGEAVLLEISSLDFIHGLNIPDLKLRADLLPGRITTMRVQFDKPGVYEFLCDNFCGSEHEEMSGKFVVS